MLKLIFWICALYVVVSFARPQDDRIQNKSPKVEKKSIEVENEVRVDLTKNITTKATSTIAPIKIAIQTQCTR